MATPIAQTRCTLYYRSAISCGGSSVNKKWQIRCFRIRQQQGSPHIAWINEWSPHNHLRTVPSSQPANKQTACWIRWINKWSLRWQAAVPMNGPADEMEVPWLWWRVLVRIFIHSLCQVATERRHCSRQEASGQVVVIRQLSGWSVSMCAEFIIRSYSSWAVGGYTIGSSEQLIHNISMSWQ